LVFDKISSLFVALALGRLPAKDSRIMDAFHEKRMSNCADMMVFRELICRFELGRNYHPSQVRNDDPGEPTILNATGRDGVKPVTQITPEEPHALPPVEIRQKTLIRLGRNG
jgi:hypothetical protein